MSNFKSTAIYLPGLLIPRVSSLALVIVMTHFLSKTEYGLITLVITIGELVDTSLTTWVRLALLRLGAGRGITTNLAKVVFQTVLMTTLIGGVISLLISVYLIPGDYLRFWAAAAIYTVGISFLRFGLALLQLGNRSVTYSGLEIARAILSFCLATLAAHLFGDTFLYPSLAVSLTTCVFATLAIFVALRDLKPSEVEYRFKDVTAFAGPLLLLSVLTIVANAMDRLFLQHYWEAATVGVYAATYSLARQPIDVIANAINTGGYPALVGHYDRGGRAEAIPFLGSQLAFFLKLVAPVVCVLYVLQDDIFLALLPKGYYAQARTVFGVIMIGAVAFNLRSTIFDNIFLVERRNLLQLKYFVGVFLAGVALALVAVPRLGVVGSGLVFAFWTTLALVMSVIFGRSLMPISVPVKEVLRAVAISALSCAMAAGAHYLLRDQSAFLRLMAGGLGATIGFCGATAITHRDQTRMILHNQRKRWRPDPA